MQSPPGSETPAKDDPLDLSGVKRKKKGASFLKELPILILIAFGLALLIKTFLVQAFFIPSGSMEPTLHGCDGCHGDRVLVNKMVYRFRDPHRGEIVVFIAERGQLAKESFLHKVSRNIRESVGLSQPPGKDFIKRVIGLPGETVQIRDSVVTITTVDGKKLTLNEPYLNKPLDAQPFGPTTVPPRTYFVMGDNRANSADSRSLLGPVKRSDIIGKAFVKVWPIGRIGLLRTPKYGVPASAAGAIVAFSGLVAIRRRSQHDPSRRSSRPAA